MTPTRIAPSSASAGSVNDLIVRCLLRRSEFRRSGGAAFAAAQGAVHRRRAAAAVSSTRRSSPASRTCRCSSASRPMRRARRAIATRYVNPDDAFAGAGSQIVAVRLWLLVRADAPEVGFIDGRAYSTAIGCRRRHDSGPGGRGRSRQGLPACGERRRQRDQLEHSAGCWCRAPSSCAMRWEPDAHRVDVDRPPARQRGAALVIGLLLLLVLTLLAVSGMSSASVELIMAGNEQYRAERLPGRRGRHRAERCATARSTASRGCQHWPTRISRGTDTYTVTITPQLGGRILSAGAGNTYEVSRQLSITRFRARANRCAARR